MVSVPIIKDCFHFPTRDGGCNGPRSFGVVGLSWAVLVKLAKVNNAPGGSVVFGGNDHPGTPLYGVIDSNLLNHSQMFIPLKPSFHVCYRVVRDSTWGGDSHRSGRGVYK